MIRKRFLSFAAALVLSLGSVAAFGQTAPPANCPNPDCPCAKSGQCCQKGRGNCQGRCRGGCRNGSTASASKK